MRSNRPRRVRSLTEVFAVPLAIAIVSLVGLVAGNGVMDVLARAALALPVAAVLWVSISRRS